MRKFLVAAGLTLMGLAFFVPSASAKSAETSFDLPHGTHVKVDLCHNVDHNAHIVPVSINAADYPYSTAHGEITLDGDLSLVSFAPHIGTGGHEHDSVVRVYTKHGNTEVDTWVSEIPCTSTPTDQDPVTAFVCFNGDISTFGPATQEDVNADVIEFLGDNEGAVQVESADSVCEEPTTTTTTTEPTTTTTTAPPVTTTTQSPVVTAPKVPAPVAAPAPAVPAAPEASLPRTGTNSRLLTSLGLGLLGVGMLLSGLLRKSAVKA